MPVRRVPVNELTVDERTKLCGLIAEGLEIGRPAESIWATVRDRYDGCVLWTRDDSLLGGVCYRTVETSSAVFWMWAAAVVRAGHRGSVQVGWGMFQDVLSTWLRLRLRGDGRPMYMVATTHDPYAYRSARQRLPTMLPRPGAEGRETSLTPPLTEAMHLYLGDSGAPFYPSTWVVGRMPLAQRPRRARTMDKLDADLRYFIERNPGYGSGAALAMVVPVGWLGFLRSALVLLRQWLGLSG